MNKQQQELVDECLEILSKEELDPKEIGHDSLYSKFLAIQNTLHMSTHETILGANEVVSSLYQGISLKAATCHYWEHRLSVDLDHEIIRVRQALQASSEKLTKDQVEDRIELDPRIEKLAKAFAKCKASRFFWDKLTAMLENVSERIDSNGKSLGVNTKFLNPGHSGHGS